MELTTIAQSYLRFLRDKLNYCEIAVQIFQLQVWCKFVPFMTFFMQLMLTKMLELKDFQEKLFLKTGYPVSTQFYTHSKHQTTLQLSDVFRGYRNVLFGTNRQNKKYTCEKLRLSRTEKHIQNDRLYQYRSNIFFLILRQ